MLSPRIRPLLGAALLALVLVPAVDAAQLTRGERALLEAVNDARADFHLRPLRVDIVLVRAARSHSAAMIRRDVFTHGAFAQRMTRYGARGPRFGENLARSTGGPVTAGEVVGSWLRSPSHRATLLRPGWKRIGIGMGVVTSPGRRGDSVVTADFAG